MEDSSRARRSSSNRVYLVPDTSVLISLCELGITDILRRLADRGFEISIPAPVVDELSVNSECLQALEGLTSGTDVPASNPDTEDLRRMLFGLGPGEIGAIVSAKNLLDSDHKVCLVLDDGRARKKAKSIFGDSVTVTGTLGLIILACEVGVISEEEALRLMRRIRDERILHLDEGVWSEAMAIFEESCRIKRRAHILEKCTRG